MRISIRPLPFLLVALAGAMRGQEQAPASERFEQGFAAARALADEGDWAEARAAWIALLDEHAGAEYVRPGLPDIRQALRRATFWEGRKEPEPESLVAAKIHRYDRGQGRLRIEYHVEDLGDFHDAGAGVLHPVVFRRKYTLELEGSPEDLGRQVFLVAVDGSDSYGVSLGSKAEGAFEYTHHRLLRLGESGAELVDSAEPKEHPARNAKPVRVKISVTEAQVKVTYDGKQILSTKKVDRKLGGFGLALLYDRLGVAEEMAFDKLIVDGTVEPAWIDSLVDAAVQEEWEAFDAAYAAPAVFAAWGEVRVEPAGTRDPNELAAMIPLPKDLFTPDQLLVTNEILKLYEEGEMNQAIARLQALDADYPPATRESLLGMAWLHLGRYEAALDHLELASGDEGPYELRRLKALLLEGTEEVEPAITELEALLALKPDDPGLYADLARLLLSEERASEARVRIDQGLAVAAGNPELVELRTQIVKATQGPAWKDPFSVKNERVVLVSDVDPRICRVAAREIEAAFRYYEERLGPLPANLAPARLFLFSGEASYLDYIQGVHDHSPENTAGLYSPTLNQMLAWNQPGRDELFLVLRHEAMHRYMDIQLGTSPRWFGEGVAEFFAIAKQEGDEWREGVGHPEHVPALERAGGELIPLQTFLYLDEEAFTKHAAACYAQAWAFVDYLRSTDAGTREVFERMWEALERNVDNRTALDETFQGVDMEALEAGFEAHVRKLTSGG